MFDDKSKNPVWIRLFWHISGSGWQSGAARTAWSVNASANTSHGGSFAKWSSIKPANFTDLAALEHRLLDFQVRYKTTATPFDWRHTNTDLNAYLERLANYEGLSAA